MRRRPRGRAEIPCSCITITIRVYRSIYQLCARAQPRLISWARELHKALLKPRCSCVKFIANNRLVSGTFTMLGCSWSWRCVTISTQHGIRPVRGIRPNTRWLSTARRAVAIMRLTCGDKEWRMIQDKNCYDWLKNGGWSVQGSGPYLLCSLHCRWNWCWKELGNTNSRGRKGRRDNGQGQEGARRRMLVEVFLTDILNLARTPRSLVNPLEQHCQHSSSNNNLYTNLDYIDPNIILILLRIILQTLKKLTIQRFVTVWLVTV